jgi:hypothetical protein
MALTHEIQYEARWWELLAHAAKLLAEDAGAVSASLAGAPRKPDGYWTVDPEAYRDAERAITSADVIAQIAHELEA